MRVGIRASSDVYANDIEISEYGCSFLMTLHKQILLLRSALFYALPRLQIPAAQLGQMLLHILLLHPKLLLLFL
jgi:hypothetical protein